MLRASAHGQTSGYKRNGRSSAAGRHMDDARIPDDIKIIAQFLAGQAVPSRPWQELTRDAFKLRRELKRRGGYRLARNGGAS